MTGLLAALLALGAPPPDPHWLAEGALTAGAALGSGLLYQATGRLARPSCPCAREEVWVGDRWAITSGRSGDEGPAHWAAAVGILGPIALSAWVSGDARSFTADALLITEAVAVASLLTQGLKLAVSRPYPYLYGPPRWPEQNGDGVNYASFPSGHTALPMAAAVVFAERLAQRRPGSPAAWGARIVGPLVALTAGALQIKARNHFLTDVIAGGALGAGVGLAVVYWR